MVVVEGWWWNARLLGFVVNSPKGEYLPALLQRMREEEVKEEEGGVVNPSRPWVRWPICLNEKEAGYWGGFKSLSER